MEGKFEETFGGSTSRHIGLPVDSKHPCTVRKSAAKILSVLGRRFKLRRYSKLEGNEVNLCLEEEDSNSIEENSSVITVISDSEGRPSDCEDIGTNTSGHRETCANITIKTLREDTTSNKNSETKRELNFGEFECDVSVEGCGEGQKRQEFSFTLYDFDGHGQITKDDIAGLVRTIYDAVGTSIKVPHGGSKTIKVKLTVSPEKSGENADTKSGPNSKSGLKVTVTENDNCSTPSGKKVNNTSENSVTTTNNNKEFKDLIKDKDSNTNNKDWSGSPDKLSRKFRSSRYHHAFCRHLSPDLTRECGGSPAQIRRKCRDANCIQRQELLDIIKVNMEKNNLGLLHKHSMDHHHRPSENHHKHHRENCTEEETKLSNNECIYQRHYHQDLAGVDSLSPKLNNSWHGTSNIPNLNTFNKPTKVCELQCSKRNGHHRSRSHDLSNNPPTHLFRYHMLDKENVADEKFHHTRTRSHDINEHHNSPKLLHSRLKSATHHSASPHHQRHRNRDQDRARAMAQVINWLEREHIGRKDGSKKDVPGSPASIERHEHHHVHEHVHHHYHHYEESAIIV